MEDVHFIYVCYDNEAAKSKDIMRISHTNFLPSIISELAGILGGCTQICTQQVFFVHETRFTHVSAQSCRLIKKDFFVCQYLSFFLSDRLSVDATSTGELFTNLRVL